MKSVTVLSLTFVFAVVAAVPYDKQRIVGGSATVINWYPSVVSLLYGQDGLYTQACGGTILNTRSILTAAHCVFGDAVARWRARVGSTWSNSGGIVHTLSRITPHASFNRLTFNNDIGILQTAATIVYLTTVRPARIANAGYLPADNQVVWAVGWGTTYPDSFTFAVQLQHVQMRIVNWAVCTTTYADVGRSVNANMICIGQVNRSQCRGDGGSPIFHNDVVVGVYSFGQECTTGRFPNVNTRVSSYAAWINNNS